MVPGWLHTETAAAAAGCPIGPGAVLNRRQLLSGLGAGALVVGFDPINWAWATAETAAPRFDRIPPLDGTLHLDAHGRFDPDGILTPGLGIFG